MNGTNPLYKKVLAELKRLKPQGDKKQRLWVQKYLGSNKPTKCIKGSIIIDIARKAIKENNPSAKELTKLLDLLYSKGKTFEEMDLAARFLGVAPKLRQEINPEKLDFWLNFTHGWAECDVLCQSNFTPEEILANWNVWKKLLTKFSKDKNVHKRRASIVLLTKAVRQSPDNKLSNLAFKNTDLLKNEKDILITKAVSWILRSLIKNHKQEVADYLNKNKDVLPKIAVREVTNKLTTGVKGKRRLN
jgi:3-methyladenine DNA glycosylase AlkD